MLRRSPKEIVDGFRDRLAKGKILVGMGTGMDAMAKHCDRSGVDLLVLYHTGRLHAAGRSALSGLLSYDDANTIIQELGDEVLPGIKKTPLLAGVCGTDPFRTMGMFLGQLKEQGFNGVQNFPTVGVVDGKFRANLEETNMSYRLEIEMIRKAHEMGLFACPYVFDEEQGEAMAEAGADVLVIHMGLATEASMKNGRGLTLEDCCGKIRGILERSKTARPDVMTLCYGRQVVDPEDAAKVIRNVPQLDGFFCIFPAKKDDSERGMAARVKGYKALDKVKALAGRRRGALG